MNKKIKKANTNNSKKQKEKTMKKQIKKLLLVFFLLLIYIYVFAVGNIPNKIVIFEGEEISMRLPFGISIKYEQSDSIETSSTTGEKVNTQAGTAKVEVNLLNTITLKNVDVDVLEKTTVIPVGNIAGVKLYTSGVLVVGMSEIEGEDNKKYKPYENTDIQEGDTIIEINENDISSTDELIQTVNASQGKDITIKYVRGEETKQCSIKPVKTSNNDYKLGLWVRDSAAGVGTVTFYEPSTKTFGALGHGITDIDTNELINIASRRIRNNKNIKCC